MGKEKKGKAGAKTEDGGFRITGFRMIPVSRLDPHPEAEAFSRGSDDQGTLNESVKDLGVLTPLHVIPREDTDGRWFVIDGVTRLLTAEKTGETELPCLTCECGDVAGFVLGVNCERRKVSTGTRIMAYLLRHKDVVLAASAFYGDGAFKGSENGKNGGLRSSVGHYADRYAPEQLAQWSSIAISDRLGASDKDVRASVELLRCHECRRVPELRQGGVVYQERDADPESESDLAAVETVRSCMRGVLGGNMPIRRWRAGFAGRVVTEGGKDEADYASLGLRAMTSLVTVFNNWGKIDPQLRGDILRKYERVREAYAKAMSAD